MAKTTSEGRFHVLIAADLTPATTDQVAFAAQFVEALGGRSTLFHVVVPMTVVAEPASPAVVLMPQAPDLDAARNSVRDLSHRLGTEHPVHIAVEAAVDARTAIVEAANRIDATMIVLPTQGRTGLKRALLGSIAEQVLRHTTRPALLLTEAMVRGRVAKDRRGPVVVATDLGEFAAQAHDKAAALAARLQRPLAFVSILPEQQPPPYGGGAPTAWLPGDPRERLQKRRRELQEQTKAFTANQQVEVFVAIASDLAKAIVDAATQLDAALLVLATHARKGVARLLLGSVAENVVRHASVPVLCVPVAPA